MLGGFYSAAKWVSAIYRLQGPVHLHTHRIQTQILRRINFLHVFSSDTTIMLPASPCNAVTNDTVSNANSPKSLRVQIRALWHNRGSRHVHVQPYRELLGRPSGLIQGYSSSVSQPYSFLSSTLGSPFAIPDKIINNCDIWCTGNGNPWAGPDPHWGRALEMPSISSTAGIPEGQRGTVSF